MPKNINLLNLPQVIRVGAVLVTIAGLLCSCVEAKTPETKVQYGPLPITPNSLPTEALQPSGPADTECTQTQTFMSSDHIYQIDAPTVCGDSFISSPFIIKMESSADANFVAGTANIEAIRDGDNNIIGCKAHDITIQGQNLAQDEFNAVALKELKTIKACAALGASGFLNKYDSHNAADPSLGLGKSLEVIDGGALLAEYDDNPDEAIKIIGTPPQWVYDMLDKAIESPLEPNCAQMQAIDMLGQNAVIAQFSGFTDQFNAVCP